MVNAFLICADFAESAKVLDSSRLFKQCREALQMINIIDNKDMTTKGYSNHPATKQWIGFTNALKAYYNAHLAELFERKSHDTKMKFYIIPRHYERPWFVTCSHVHNSHKASLIRKNPYHYSKLTCPEEYQKYSYFYPYDLVTKGLDHSLINEYPLSLICRPLPSQKRCPAVMKSGKRKGQICYNAVKHKDDTFCGTHKNYK